MAVSTPIIEQYVRFCESPLRGRTEIEQDYDRLGAHPMVVSVGFLKPHILMVGTKPIIIPFKGEEYDIGEFIIFLIRKRIGRIWATNFRFANTTNTIWDKYHDGTTMGILHPHILLDEYEDIKFHTGRLCISQGGPTVFQAIRKGHMDKAVAMLINILYSYGTGQPFRKIEHWETKETSND